MLAMRRCLERQEREIKERGRRRAEEKRVQQEDDEKVVMAVGMLDLSRQGCHRGSQVARNWTMTNLDPTLIQQNIFHGCPRPYGFDGRCHKMVNKNEN
ncbi:unnamed protein product [Prunus armeniaca]